MVDISQLVYEHLKERPEFAWIGILEKVSEQFEQELAARETELTNRLDIISAQLLEMMDIVTASQPTAESPTAPAPEAAQEAPEGATEGQDGTIIATAEITLTPASMFDSIEILDRRKHGSRVMTAPPRRLMGGYRAAIEQFIASEERRVVFDMESEGRHVTTVYSGLRENIKPEDELKAFTKEGDVFLLKTGKPKMHGVTLTCGEGLHPSRQSEGGPGSEHHG